MATLYNLAATELETQDVLHLAVDGVGGDLESVVIWADWSSLPVNLT